MRRTALTNASIDFIVGNNPPEAGDDRGLHGCVDEFRLYKVTAANQDFTPALAMEVKQKAKQFLFFQTLPLGNGYVDNNSYANNDYNNNNKNYIATSFNFATR